MTPVKPGMVLTPASIASFFEVILSPIASMARVFGPMKAMPFSASISQNEEFSERKP